MVFERMSGFQLYTEDRTNRICYWTECGVGDKERGQE